MLQDTSQKELTSTVSIKGQVTIPIKVRKYLKVAVADKVAFIIGTDGAVRLTQAKYPNIASICGVAGSLSKELSFKEMRDIASKDRLSQKYER